MFLILCENDDHSHVSQSLSARLLKTLFACTHLGTWEFVALTDVPHLPLTDVFVCVCAAQVTREVCSCNSAQSPMLDQYAGWRHPARIMQWLETSS